MNPAVIGETALAAGVHGFLRDLHILEFVALGLESLPSEEPDPAGAIDRRPPATPPIGRRWRQFRLTRRIATGSYGTVYRAFDTIRGVEVALKLPNGDHPCRDSTRQLLQEARRLRLVRHPGVVRLHGVAVEGEGAGLWMDLLPGRTLDGIVRSRGPLGVREVATIGAALASALGAVHGAGLIHGDIKPQNVMLGPGGGAVLIDFGSAQPIARSTTALRRVTGTPLYLAPEITTGSAVSTASDIYSLGVLLFHLASGDYPVRADTLDELLAGHRRGDARRLQTLRPDLPAAFCRIVERATAVDPRARYASAGALQRALARALLAAAPRRPPIRRAGGQSPSDGRTDRRSGRAASRTPPRPR